MFKPSGIRKSLKGAGPAAASTMSGPMRAAANRASSNALEFHQAREARAALVAALKARSDPEAQVFAVARAFLAQLDGEPKERGKILLDAWENAHRNLRALEKGGLASLEELGAARRARHDAEGAWDAFAESQSN